MLRKTEGALVEHPEGTGSTGQGGRAILRDGGNLILRPAGTWGGRISASLAAKRCDAQKKALDQSKMNKTVKKRKHQSLGKRISAFLRPDLCGLFPAYSS